MYREYAVVIPARNEADHIADAVRSALAQTIAPSEVIVADDASTDATAQIAEACGARVLRTDQPCGPGGLRNRAVAAAAAPVVGFLDADDLWKPEHAERVLGAMQHSGCGFGGSAAERFGSATGVMRSAFALGRDVSIADNLIVDNPIIQSTVFIERATFQRAGGYDEAMRLSEDYDLWQRVAEFTEFAYVDDVTIRRRMHAGQYSVRRQSDLIRFSWRARRQAAHRRLARATPDERSRIHALLTDAARRDLDWAVWTGRPAMLRLVRDELGVTDYVVGDGLALAALAGKGVARRRLALELKTRARGAFYGLVGERR